MSTPRLCPNLWNYRSLYRWRRRSASTSRSRRRRPADSVACVLSLPVSRASRLTRPGADRTAAVPVGADIAGRGATAVVAASTKAYQATGRNGRPRVRLHRIRPAAPYPRRLHMCAKCRSRSRCATRTGMLDQVNRAAGQRRGVQPARLRYSRCSARARSTATTYATSTGSSTSPPGVGSSAATRHRYCD